MECAGVCDLSVESRGMCETSFDRNLGSGKIFVLVSRLKSQKSIQMLSYLGIVLKTKETKQKTNLQILFKK